MLYKTTFLYIIIYDDEVQGHQLCVNIGSPVTCEVQGHQLCVKHGSPMLLETFSNLFIVCSHTYQHTLSGCYLSIPLYTTVLHKYPHIAYQTMLYKTTFLYIIIYDDEVQGHQLCVNIGSEVSNIGGS